MTPLSPARYRRAVLIYGRDYAEARVEAAE